MKKLIIAIFCLSFISISFSQNADAEYLKIQKEYTLNKDGSVEYHYYKEIKLLSHYAFHRLYGETFILYNTDYQTLKINSAYTIMADGKKIVTPDNAFNKVLPRFSTNAPSYNNIREMVVTHTGLEVGATIYLDYTLTSKAGYSPYLMSDDVLSESSPVKELNVKVNVPKSANLHYELLNSDVETVVGKKDSFKVYNWTFKSLDATSKDYYQEEDQLSLPRLLFSTADNLTAAYSSFVNQAAFDFVTDAAMDKFVLDITNENTDKLKIALELQKVVSGQLNNLSVPVEYSGFICRTAVETWNSNKGTQLEKAILFTALLKKAGIEAEVVSIVPNSYYNEEIGNMLIFNNFLVRVNLKDQKEQYLSADHGNKQNLIFSLDGKKIISLDKNLKSPRLYSVKSKPSKIFVNSNLEIKADSKLVGEMHLVLEANSNPYYSLLNDSSKIKSMVKGGISPRDITSFETDQLTQKEVSSRLNIEKEKAFNTNDKYSSFVLPFIDSGVDSWHINLLGLDRYSPLEIPEAIHERYDFIISLGEEFDYVAPLTDIEITNEVGHILIKFVKKGMDIIIIREINLKKKIVEPSDYNNFREIMNAWNNANFKKLTLKTSD